MDEKKNRRYMNCLEKQRTFQILWKSLKFYGKTGKC